MKTEICPQCGSPETARNGVTASCTTCSACFLVEPLTPDQKRQRLADVYAELWQHYCDQGMDDLEAEMFVRRRYADAFESTLAPLEDEPQAAAEAAKENQ